MKHEHKVDVEITDISTDVETVIDKVTESVITIIVVASAAHILRRWLT